MPLRSRRAAVRLLSALVLVLAFLVLGFAIQVGGPLPVDRALDARSSGQALSLMRGVSGVASLAGWAAIVLVVGLALWLRGCRREALALVAADATAELVDLVGKLLFHRLRPDGAPADDLIATSSFPSGHTLRVVVVLGYGIALLVQRRPAWRVPALAAGLAFMLLVGIARVAVGAHWPSDVLGAYLLGAAWLQVVLVSLPARPPMDAAAVRRPRRIARERPRRA